MAELARPGRDPRQQFEEFKFADGVEKPADLKPGMKLPGIVTNVTAFGAFVDVGVHQDGLVHISQIADHFVKNPAEVLKAGQKVHVTVTEIDLERNRISLSMKSRPEIGPKTASNAGGPSRKDSKDARGPKKPGPQGFGMGLLANAFDQALGGK